MGNAARAPADGYTIAFVSSSFVVNPRLYERFPYDPEKDFVADHRRGLRANGLWSVRRCR